MSLPLSPLSYTQLSGFLGQLQTGKGDGPPQAPQRRQHQEFERQGNHTGKQRVGGAWLEGAEVLGATTEEPCCVDSGGGCQDYRAAQDVTCWCLPFPHTFRSEVLW